MEAFYMRRAIELANLAVSNGAQPYGALIADPATDPILAEGCEKKKARQNHARTP